MQQGKVFDCSAYFDPCHQANFACIGCNSWADSTIRMATAPAPEGPWSEFHPLVKVNGIDHADNYMYCMYPHPWGFAPEQGKMLVSWSEHWPGGVIMGELEMQMKGEAKEKYQVSYQYSDLSFKNIKKQIGEQFSVMKVDLGKKIIEKRSKRG
jgi:hypothetical protein